MQEFQDHVEVRKDYLELIKTPEDLRKDAGVDEYLTTQRRRDRETHQRAKHKRYREALRPAMRRAMESMRQMRKDGASQAAILRQIIPRLGPQASKQDPLEGLAKNTQQTKQQLKDAQRAKLGKMAMGMSKIKKEKGKDESEAKEAEEQKEVRNNFELSLENWG